MRRRVNIGYGSEERIEVRGDCEVQPAMVQKDTVQKDMVQKTGQL